MFYFLTASVLTAIWCAASTTFESFMAARILNGFFSTVSQAGGLMFIYDMFYFHERARKINIWAGFIIVSPYIGPCFAAFMIATNPWPVPFWVYSAMSALALILTILFVEETFYDRRIDASAQPAQGSRISRLLGISQYRSRQQRNTFGQACSRIFIVFAKPPVFVASLYYALTFAWVVGINGTLTLFLTPLYKFEATAIGLFYFTPIVATVLGEIAGHWIHDVLAKRYIKSHKGHFEPEVRLRAIGISLPFMVIGLAMLGQSLGNEWHYMATSVFWGLYVFGVMITTVALNAYVLDCYPEASGEVAAWLNFARVLGGFIISYFQVEWALKQGVQKSFGIQSAVVAAAFILVIILMKFGKSWRVKSGPLNFKTS